MGIANGEIKGLVYCWHNQFSELLPIDIKIGSKSPWKSMQSAES
jgi:hypothetical protein